MLAHLKKKKDINFLLSRFKKKTLSSSDSESSEDSQEIRKRKLCEEIGNNSLKENLKVVKRLFKKYKEELKDYIYIGPNDFKKLKLGGFIRYVKMTEEIRYGGLLTDVKDDEKYETLTFIIRKTNGQFYNVPFERNYIFFRERRTKSYYLNKKLLEISEFYKE